MKRTIAGIFTLVLALSLTVAAGSAPSQPSGSDFPNREIVLVCPWGAGGGADLICRMFEKLGPRYFGVPVVVVNQAGAAGQTATVQYVQTAAPNGYTVLFNNGGNFTSKTLMDNCDYSIDDFTPITGICRDINVLVARADLGYKTLDELIRKFKESGEAILYGCGAGSAHHVDLASVFSQAGVSSRHVAYNGVAEWVPALLGGDIDVISVGVSELSSIIGAENAVIMAIFNKDRIGMEHLKDIPTVFEYGYNADADVWRMLLVQKDTPDEIVARLREGFLGMINDPEFVKFTESSGLIIDTLSPEGVLQKIKDELEATIVIFKELKLGIFS